MSSSPWAGQTFNALGALAPFQANQGYWVLPGLTNAHDHLDFNLYPRLGNPPYPNSYLWGADIYQPEAEPVRSILALPKRDRLLWGAYRNLLSGVTTVQHHNPWHWSMAWDFPVRVPAYGWAHSPEAKKIFRPHNRPFFIHAAEGTDLRTSLEINHLAQRKLLGPQTVIIHGINLSPADIALLRQTRTQVVWCPSSNLFLYGRTAPIHDLLAAGVPVALGSDSTCSGLTDLIAEVHFATQWLAPAILYEMVTTQAAKMLGMVQPQDFLLVHAPRATSAAEALLQISSATLHLVVRQGQVWLLAPPLVPWVPTQGLRPIKIDHQTRFVRGPLPELLQRTGYHRSFFGKLLQH